MISADFLIGSLDGPDRLLVTDGSGHLKAAMKVIANRDISVTEGTLGLALADLNGDGKVDMVQGQGEAAWPEAVFLGTQIEPDSAPPVISMVESVQPSAQGASLRIRARVHDNASTHDLKAVVVRWRAGGQTQETPLHWYGEYLWRGAIDGPAAAALDGQVCATDLAGNEACAPLNQ